MRNKTTGTLSTAIINIWSFKVLFVIILRTYSFNFFMYYFSFKKGHKALAQRIKSHLMLCYLKFELKKSWLSTFIFSAPIFGYQRKESFTKLQLKSLIIHSHFSNQLMWLCIVVNSGEYSSCSSIQIYHFWTLRRVLHNETLNLWQI